MPKFKKREIREINGHDFSSEEGEEYWREMWIKSSNDFKEYKKKVSEAIDKIFDGVDLSGINFKELEKLTNNIDEIKKEIER
jgi:polyhydroxyalkanoate synthesis regulator phasin